MKFLVIAFVLFATLIAVQSKDAEIKEFIMQCKKENNVSEEECKAFHESGKDKSKATNNIKCATKCLFEKLGAVSNGELIAEKVGKYAENVTMENVTLAVENCNKESGVDECDDAFQKGSCIIEVLKLAKF